LAFDIILLALESTTQPYDPQRRLTSSLSPTETRATNPLLAFRACLLPLSFHPKTLVSLVLNQVCHIKPFSFALRVFSMKWSNRRSAFFPFVHPRFLRTLHPPPPAAAFVFAPSNFPKDYRIVSPPQLFPEETRILRVLGHLSSQLSQSRSLWISVMNVSRIKYMLKQYSRIRFPRLLSNPRSISFLFQKPFFFLSPPHPLHLSSP
jgi:hypothetical protein